MQPPTEHAIAEMLARDPGMRVEDDATKLIAATGKCICFACGQKGHTTQFGFCPVLGNMCRNKLLWRAMPADEGRGYLRGDDKEKELAHDILDLTAYQHVSFGNTHTKSLYFSASRKMDPAIFWSTRTLNERLQTCPSRGHNWDRVGIAILNTDYCYIKYDVSDAMRAAINGINKVMIYDQQRQWVSDQRVFGLATSNHEVILSKVEARACVAFYTVKELCLWGLWTRGEADDKVPMDVQLARWRSYEQWGCRSRQSVIPSDWLHWLPR